MGKLIITKDELIRAQEDDAESFEKLMVNLRPICEKNYKKYKYLSEELYYAVFTKGIRFLITNSKLDMIYDFYEYVENKFSSIIEFQIGIAINEEPAIIDSYIKLLKKNRLVNLAKFFNKMHVDWGIDNYINLLNSYDDIEHELKKLIGDEKKIEAKTISKLANNEYMEQFIRAYMMKHDIEEVFEGEDEEELDVGSENGVDFSEVTDPVKLFLLEIGRYSLLKYEEEKHYFKLLKEGHEEYRELLINSNLRLVVSIAKRYLNRGVLFQDLIQEGSIGLMKAIDLFDYEKGYKFSTYATWWIRQAITRSIGNDGRTVRLPIHVHEKVNLIRKAQIKFQAMNNREPSNEELSAILDMPVQTIVEYLTVAHDPTSLSLIIGDEDTELESFIPDRNVNVEEEALETDLQIQVRKLLENSNMDDRLKEIIKYRFGFYGRVYTLEEVGAIFKLTRERVRQLETKALRRLRQNRSTKDFVVYMDDPVRAEEYIKSARGMACDSKHSSKVPGFEEDEYSNETKKKPKKEENIKTGTFSLLEYLKLSEDKQDYLFDVIVSLDEATLDLLARQFGKDFNGLKKSNLTAEERDKLFIYILPNLSRVVNSLMFLDRDSMEYTNRLEHISEEVNVASYVVFSRVEEKMINGSDEEKVLRDEEKIDTRKGKDEEDAREDDEEFALEEGEENLFAETNDLEEDDTTLSKEEVLENPLGEESIAEVMSNDTSGEVQTEVGRENAGIEKDGDGMNMQEVSETKRKKGSQSFNLIQYFNEVFTKSELMCGIEMLGSRERDIFLAVCGEELDGANTLLIDKEERKRFNTNYIPKLKNRLTKLYPDKVALAFKSRNARKDKMVEDIIKEDIEKHVKEGEDEKKEDESAVVVGTIKQEDVGAGAKMMDMTAAKKTDTKKTFKIVPVPDLPFIGVGKVTQTEMPEEEHKEPIGDVLIGQKEEKDDYLELAGDKKDGMGEISLEQGESIEREETIHSESEGRGTKDTNNLISNGEFTMSDLEFIRGIISQEEFQTMIKMSFTIEEVLVALMLHYGYNGRTFNVTEIALFLHTSEDNIIDIARRSVGKYKELMNKKFDEYEEHLLRKKDN